MLGVEGRGRAGGWSHVEFCQAKISTHISEGRERFLSSDELCHKLKTLIEPTQDVEHKGAILNGLAEVGEGISHALHLATELIDGESALGEDAKLGVE